MPALKAHFLAEPPALVMGSALSESEPNSVFVAAGSVAVATLTPEGNLNGDVVQEKFPSIHETKPTAQNPSHRNPVPVSSGGILAANGDDEETVSVTVSITISQRVYGNHHQGNGMYGQTASSRNENNHRATATDPAATR